MSHSNHQNLWTVSMFQRINLPQLPRHLKTPMEIRSILIIPFPMRREKWASASTGVRKSRLHLCLSGADSNFVKEAVDMGLDHQQMKLSPEQTVGKIR
ncbi:hypothetical protein AVEN_2731-1 [Araneus ventricosus]|uniref:Uncharacterized protein n=1 Tax=Araneus ventricosus TaxID=182803 RepID=A0A4Y2WCU9_ARAVE|nr:hypothetical protein AVEN_2731-1 [Araneus ventricosus]